MWRSRQALARATAEPNHTQGFERATIWNVDEYLREMRHEESWHGLVPKRDSLNDDDVETVSLRVRSKLALPHPGKSIEVEGDYHLGQNDYSCGSFVSS